MAAAKPKSKLSLSLANVRDPRRAKLSPAEKKQWRGLIAQEGLDDGDEDSVQLVDVLEGGAVRYQLYLWSFGSAALFPAGKTKPVGGAVQHTFRANDLELCAALAAAWKASAKKLRLREALRFELAKEPLPHEPGSEPRRGERRSMAAPSRRRGVATATTQPAGGGVAHAIAALRSLVTAGKGREASRAADALRDETFTAWRLYPKLLVDDLSADQRAVLEVLLDLELARDLANCGLFNRDAHLARFLGRSRPGPSDVTLEVGERTVPVWWAVSAVGSGHARPDEVLKGWKKVPTVAALAAWTEIARDGAYDVLTVRATSMKDAGFSSKPYMVDYRTRVVSLLADVSLALGAEGEKAARALTTRLPSWGGAWQVFVAIASGLRHANGAPLDTAYDKTFAKLWERVGGDSFHAPALATAIEEALPRERAKAFVAGLRPPRGR
ncbi:MAG TPA: hypothetical protein PK141_08530 [Polyangiaceae bacterium]|nr:hypothetical protein [Polyangiaceae bacterium]